MTSIKPIPPFFDDAAKTAPPPFPPLLTDQQELFVNHCAANACSSKPDQKIEYPLNIPIPRDFKLAHRPSPYLKKVDGEKEAITTGSSDVSDVSSESCNTDIDDTSSNLSEDSKIPKPTGGPGRHRKGGYHLETALRWNDKDFAKLKKLTHHLVNEHLDTSKCASMQNLELLQVVRNQVVDAIPDLEHYSNSWPVDDLITMRLKHTSSRARRQEQGKVMGKGKKATKVVKAK